MAAAIVALSMTLAARAEMVAVTDITGRQVEVNVPVERVILGEGRQVYLVAALDTEDPFKRIAGWREDFSQADPDNYAAYLEKFPRMAEIPTFGGFKDGTFDVEQAVSLKPDVILMNIESKQATEDAKYIEKLAAAGIPLVYVDSASVPLPTPNPARACSASCSARRSAPRNSSPGAPPRSRALPTSSRRPSRKGPRSSSNAPAAIRTIAA
ncbi:hypothetical protein X759_11675 [Mesorhizobium sp. LSHC420B00]|nr:hypothetical protein X759_11675 [Mesorhizobium sp. LSHC420B00]